MEYKGILLAIDSYMNLQLADTEEYVDGELAGNLGEVLIRCNNVNGERTFSAHFDAPDDGRWVAYFIEIKFKTHRYFSSQENIS